MQNELYIINTAQEATRNESIIVTNASQTICNAIVGTMPPRKVLTIRNIADDATKIITINIGNNPAVANVGIVLRQYESFTDSADGGYLPFQGTITAICAVASATATIAVFER